MFGMEVRELPQSLTVQLVYCGTVQHELDMPEHYFRLSNSKKRSMLERALAKKAAWFQVNR